MNQIANITLITPVFMSAKHQAPVTKPAKEVLSTDKKEVLTNSLESLAAVNAPIVKKVQKEFFSEDKSKRALFFVQVIPYKQLDVTLDDFKPYGHFCVFYDVYGRTGWGWKGFGLWSKQNFTTYKLVGKN